MTAASHRQAVALWLLATAVLTVILALIVMTSAPLDTVGTSEDAHPAAPNRVGPNSLRRWEARGRYLDEHGQVRAEAWSTSEYR